MIESSVVIIINWGDLDLEFRGNHCLGEKCTGSDFNFRKSVWNGKIFMVRP